MWYWPVITLLLLFPQISVGEEINAGFVNGLWYSEDTIFAEETVRVYVAIRNNTDADLTGMVTFFNNDKKIGTQTITALNGRIIESWIDWKPAYGENTIKAELSQLKLSVVGKDIENINIAIAAATDNIFVDYDTDGDNIGNNTDSDDDNDSISDIEETRNNTNPLVKNSDNNSANNAKQTLTNNSEIIDDFGFSIYGIQIVNGKNSQLYIELLSNELKKKNKKILFEIVLFKEN